MWLILTRLGRGDAGGCGFDDVLPGLVGIGGVALDDALDELVGGLFTQAFLDAAGGDGFEPLAEVFFEGGLPQQGLHALGAACGGEEVGAGGSGEGGDEGFVERGGFAVSALHVALHGISIHAAKGLQSGGGCGTAESPL